MYNPPVFCIDIFSQKNSIPPPKLEIALQQNHEVRDRALAKHEIGDSAPVWPKTYYFGGGRLVHDSRPTHALAGVRIGEADHPGPSVNKRQRPPAKKKGGDQGPAPAPKQTSKQVHRARHPAPKTKPPKKREAQERRTRVCDHKFCHVEMCFVQGHYHEKKRKAAVGAKLREIQKQQAKDRAEGTEQPKPKPIFVLCETTFGCMCADDHFHSEAQLLCGSCVEEVDWSKFPGDPVPTAPEEEEKADDHEIEEPADEPEEPPEEAIQAPVVVPQSVEIAPAQTAQVPCDVSELTLSGPAILAATGPVPELASHAPEVEEVDDGAIRNPALAGIDCEWADRPPVPLPAAAVQVRGLPPDEHDFIALGLEAVYVYSRLPGARDRFNQSLCNRFLELFLTTDIELRRNKEHVSRYTEIVEGKSLGDKTFVNARYPGWEWLKQKPQRYQDRLSKRVHTDVVRNFGFNSCTLEMIYTPLYEYLWRHPDLRKPQYVDDANVVRHYYSGKMRIVAETHESYAFLDPKLCDTTLSYLFFQFTVRDYINNARKGILGAPTAPGKEKPSVRKVILNGGGPRG